MNNLIGLLCLNPSINCYLLGSFEITVNGVLIFSKLKCDRFPLTEAVVSKVIAIAHGETPKEVIDYETSNCNLL
ncbi:hypothetical protein KSF78_0000026 [Schistosoma japonicum]|nr:hypothetical protein KSF78_0000026 [Schistosoma japonicum]